MPRLVECLYYLKTALAALLVFIGAKMARLSSSGRSIPRLAYASSGPFSPPESSVRSYATDAGRAPHPPLEEV